MAKEWDVLVALETLLGTIATFGTVSIGFENDLFHKTKFRGQLPAIFIEYAGNEEEGPLDSSDERYVPFTATLVIIQKADSVKKNRREKVQTAITYKNLIADAIDGDPQLGSKQVALSMIRATRVLDADERVPTPYWAIEIDLECAVWETKAGR